jgi:drug/metabolite transporter (DMT)-like permease
MEGGALTTTTLWSLIGFPLAMLSYIFFSKKKEQSLFQKVIPVLPLLSYLAISLFLMQYLTMIVLSELLIAYSLALFQFSMVLQVFLGYRIFKEQNIKSRLIACLIMAIGSLLVLNA